MQTKPNTPGLTEGYSMKQGSWRRQTHDKGQAADWQRNIRQDIMTESSINKTIFQRAVYSPRVLALNFLTKHDCWLRLSYNHHLMILLSLSGDIPWCTEALCSQSNLLNSLDWQNLPSLSPSPALSPYLLFSGYTSQLLSPWPCPPVYTIHPALATEQRNTLPWRCHESFYRNVFPGLASLWQVGRQRVPTSAKGMKCHFHHVTQTECIHPSNMFVRGERKLFFCIILMRPNGLSNVCYTARCDI